MTDLPKREKFNFSKLQRQEMDEYKDEPMGWGARIAAAIGLGILMAIIAYGCASALDYDDYSADYWDSTGRYRQIDEERRMEREAQERDWATRYENNNEEEEDKNERR